MIVKVTKNNIKVRFLRTLTIGGGGSGTVKSVNGVLPNVNGDVYLSSVANLPANTNAELQTIKDELDYIEILISSML